jgi:hypothetical protein
MAVRIPKPIIRSIAKQSPDYLVRLMAATSGQMSNAMCVSSQAIMNQSKTSSFLRPRTNLESWKSRLPTGVWNHLARARGAHLNSMEVFPLFAAAMVSLTINLPQELIDES